MPRAKISEFVHVVVIGIHFHVYLEILKPYLAYFKVLPFFNKTIFSMGKSLRRTLYMYEE